MERRRLLLLVQLPLVVLWTCAFLIARCGDEGRLGKGVLGRDVYPTLRRLEGTYTDLKFNLRGSRPVRNKIVIVGIDDESVKLVGRWPWHRDAVAGVVLQAEDAGAKVVGLDIVFSEPDQRVPDAVADVLKGQGLGDQIPTFETDLLLQRVIDVYKDRLVLGWMTDSSCRPADAGAGDCVVTGSEPLAPDYAKFAYGKFEPGGGFDPAHTRLVSVPGLLGNLPGYTQAALHAGFLVNAAEDPDDVVRRAQVVVFLDGKPQPSMPLEMAAVGLGARLDVALDGDGLVDHLALVGGAGGDRGVTVNPSGTLAINFRGGFMRFPYVSAVDLLKDDAEIPVQQGEQTTKRPRADVFKDAYVLIGVTAAGARDLRHFPFGKNIPGTEGLATILDDVLAGDALTTSAPGLGLPFMLLLMVVGGGLFGLLMMRLPALPAMASALGAIGLIAGLDVWVVFGQLDVDLHSVFLLAELATLFIATVATKYVLEERGKRFIRSTFSRYLAPAVVDQMLKDPAKMQLGGETRRLTIMMSDLRGFTAMAGRMKPAEVLTVLNHYLGAMADVIMEYGGTIDEFIGDAILVIFGAPLQAPDDARRAVACAIAMQRAMGPINEHNATLDLPRLEMGIALNTGDVIVGNIGSQKHVKYGVVGSHVNLTARIESNTVGGQVLISGATLELAGDDVKVGEQQMIVAKGFPEPIAAYEVTGIGGEYGLELEEVDLGLVDLDAPLEVRLRVMRSKNEEGDEQAGRFTSLSMLGATLASEATLEALANLKLHVLGDDGEPIDGDLYAKVVAADGEGADASCQLRFTSVPPAVEAAIALATAPNLPERSSELAERD